MLLWFSVEDFVGQWGDHSFLDSLEIQDGVKSGLPEVFSKFCNVMQIELLISLAVAFHLPTTHLLICMSVATNPG